MAKTLQLTARKGIPSLLIHPKRMTLFRPTKIFIHLLTVNDSKRDTEIGPLGRMAAHGSGVHTFQLFHKLKSVRNAGFYMASRQSYDL
jgi:hypothetical protein